MLVCLFVYPSIRPSAWNNSALIGQISMKFDTRVFFENLSRKFKFYSNLKRITGTLHKDQYTFFVISRSFLLRMRNIWDKFCRENQNTLFIFNNFFFPENRAVYEKMWENNVDPDRLQMTIWRMRISSWVPTTTDTPSEYVFPLQKLLHKSIWM